MPKVFTSPTQKIGQLGEEIACTYLKGQGFTILERNYYKIRGEIDIIAKKGSILHFIEVKAVSCETQNVKNILIRPEENFTYAKSQKFKKIVEIYLASKHVSHETCFEIDLLAIYLDKNTRKAKVKPFWRIIL